MEMTFENAVEAFIKAHDHLPTEPLQPSQSESYYKYNKWYLRNCNGFLATVDSESVVRLDGEVMLPDMPILSNSNEYSIIRQCKSKLREHSRQLENFADEYEELNLSREEYLNAVYEIASEGQEIIDLACAALSNVRVQNGEVHPMLEFEHLGHRIPENLIQELLSDWMRTYLEWLRDEEIQLAYPNPDDHSCDRSGILITTGRLNKPVQSWEDFFNKLTGNWHATFERGHGKRWEIFNQLAWADCFDLASQIVSPDDNPEWVYDVQSMVFGILVSSDIPIVGFQKNVTGQNENSDVG